MNWWEIIPEVNCIFAIDATSKYTSSKVFFANNINRFLTNYSGNNKVSLTGTFGWKYKNLELILPMEKYIYKALNFNDVNMIFDVPILLPNEFTFILKCKVNTTTVFISNNGQDYGMVYGTDTNSASVWHIKDFVTDTLEYSKQQFESVKFNNIQTVILKGNIADKDVTFITDYGSYKVPKDSVAFNSFLKSQTYTTLGHTHSSTAHSLKVDIIAYGLFNKNFSDTDVSQILSCIDKQFKIKTSPIKILNRSRVDAIQFLNVFKPKLKELNKIYEIFNSAVSRYQGVTTVLNDNISSLNVINCLYKNTYSIKDIVLEEGLPVQSKLYLYDKATGELLKTTVSNIKGEFLFIDLNTNFEYIVTATDPKYQFQSIIKDYNI